MVVDVLESVPSGLDGGVPRALQRLDRRWRIIDRSVFAGLMALGGVLTWRACSQAITYDEAFTWLTLLRGPLHEILTTNFSANNHVLFSLSAWLTTNVLGVSEFSLRLPSVIAAWISLWIIRELAKTIGGRGTLYPVTAVALALNPFMLDFLIAARGYSMATAAILFAVLRLLRMRDTLLVSRSDLVVLGLAAGVATAANMAFAFPALAVVIASIGFAADDRRKAIEAAGCVGISALGVVSILTLPLLTVQPGTFFYGARSFFQASRSLVAASLQYDTSNRWFVTDGVVDVVAGVLVPLALVSCVVASAIIAIGARRRGRLWPGPGCVGEDHWPLVSIGSVMGLTIAVSAGANFVSGLLLPLERTGLYWLPLTVLGLGAAARACSGNSGPSFVGRTALQTSMMALAVVFTAQFTHSHFRTWRFDAGSRDSFAMVDSWPCPADRVRRVTTTAWLFEPAIEFYRVIRRAAHVQPLNIVRESYEPGDADFYVVYTVEEIGALASVAIPVFLHELSGATLLVDKRAAACVSAFSDEAIADL